MLRHICVLLSFVCLSACGGGSGGSPTGPGNTTPTAISIGLRDVVLAGTTANATATATLGNGQTQAVTTGFQSDAAGVATVTDAGVVTGVSNGEATISVSSGGVQGSKRIRVAPNYEGTWQGRQVITACTTTGDFIGLCDEGGSVIGESFPIGMRTRHPSDLSVSGEFSIEQLPFPTFTTSIEGDGGIRFTSTTVIEGIRAEATWQVNSREAGRVTGTIRERYTVPGVPGDLVFESTLAGFNRAGPALEAPMPPPQQAL